MCLYPTLVPNPKYKKTKKNGGIIPPISDTRVTRVPIGCTRCVECMKQKAREWKIRLLHEIQTPAERSFITLTFNNDTYTDIYHTLKKKNSQVDGYTLDNWIAKWAVRHFLERWRKKYKKSLRHLLITELGHNGTENIHLHGILWSRDIKEITKMWGVEDNKTKIWKPYGYVWPRDEEGMKRNWVNEQTIGYITKYITKIDVQHKTYKPEILATHKPAIGAGYENTFNAQQNKYVPGETKETYTDRTGAERALPIYYRNKIYTEEEREKLWIEKLDKKERWVMGVKIDISTAKGEQEYHNALKHAQKINKQLGYGNDQITWEQREYEKQLRILKQQERLRREV